MKKIKFLVLIITAFSCCTKLEAVEPKGLGLIISFLSGEMMENRLKKAENEDLLQSIGLSNYTFIDYVSHQNKKYCYPNDMNLPENNEIPSQKKKSEIKIKCILGAGNGTLQVIDSLKDVSTLLAAHGNTTKRNQLGNCALILFYTKSCPGSALVAPHFNAIARQFPDLRIAAIDAFQHHSLNTEFGILGLPTVMLFHQGRPVVKFNDTASTVTNFAKFVTKHTDIKPVNVNVIVTSEDYAGPLPNKVVIETDHYLALAWVFIISCAAFYFSKSIPFLRITEMIQRNWRESGEARHAGVN